MEDNTPHASIHVGKNKKSFSAAESNEAERRGWDQKRYDLKNADKEKNNHYNFSRNKLNFEIVKGGKIMPLGSNPVPLHDRLQHRLEELKFKPYMDKDHPDQIADNSPNCTVTIIFSGDRNVMCNLAFGDQELDTSDPNADQSNIILQPAIYDWALDTYNFACRKWGEENIIAFDVHCDETNIHAHVQTVPVDKVKKRGRIGSIYVNKDNPEIKLTTKEWKKLPKDERSNYTKTKAEKEVLECVSYAKVWGESKDEKSTYLSDLHTDYHKQVGYKYGLERGIPEEELTEEEKRERKHKDKKVLEAERQAKEAVVHANQTKEEVEKSLDSLKEYAVLATIDKKELSFPVLDINQPIQEAKDAVTKELSISIPNFGGQKDWRESRTANISSIIETLVSAINAARDRQNEEVKANVNKQYAYYMQHLHILVEKDKLIVAKNKSLESENAQLKDKLSKLDADTVDKLTKENSSLRNKYNELVDKLNIFLEEPEIQDAIEHMKLRKQRKEQIINKFIKEGHDSLLAFTKSSRIDFSREEAQSILYGIIANAIKNGLSLNSEKEIETATTSFLDSIPWSNISDFRKDCTCKWTQQLVLQNTSFDELIIGNFLSFVDAMSCSQDTYVSLMGSNGCADQLSNWDGTKKRGLSGVEQKKKKKGQTM